jgi:hypothetical protein
MAVNISPDHLHMRHRAQPAIVRLFLLIVTASLAATCLAIAVTIETGQGPALILRHWPDYYRALADRQPQREEVWLRALVAMEPRDTDAVMRLAAVAEWRGDLADARQLLERAASRDARYRAQWALLDFEARHPGSSFPREIARRCFSMSYGDRRILLETVWSLRPDGRFLVDELLPDSPGTLYQATSFLMDQDELPAARKAFGRLIRQPIGSPGRANAGIVGTALERAHLGLDLADLHLDRRDPESAVTLWHSLVERRLIAVDGAAEAGRQVVNSRFRTEPLGRGFDWRMAAASGVEMRRVEDGWRVDFGSRPPDRAELLTQRILVTDHLMPLEIDSSAPDWVQATVTAGPPIPGTAMRVARLRIEYRRPPGQPPLREPLVIRQVRWRPA